MLGQGGNPFTPNVLVNNSFASKTGRSSFEWFPNQVGDPQTSGQSGTITQWYNPAGLPAAKPGTLGNMRRNSIYGPGVHVMNASIRKTFTIYERVAFEFSVDATNLVNHPSFSQPDLNIGGRLTMLQSRESTQGGRGIALIGQIRF